MKSESEDLENTFSGEDADEAHVEVLQSKHPHLSLAVVVQCHGQHVETNENHDYHIKLFIGHNSNLMAIRSLVILEVDAKNMMFVICDLKCVQLNWTRNHFWHGSKP